MPRPWPRARACGLLPWLLLAAHASWAQPAARDADPRCQPGIDYEAAGFRVRDVKVETLFGFLPWYRPALRQAQAEADQLLKGQPYRLETANQARDRVRAYSFARPDDTQRVSAAWAYTRLENCADQVLDLRLFAAAPSVDRVVGGTIEAFRLSRVAPEVVAGAQRQQDGWRLTPRIGSLPGEVSLVGVRLRRTMAPDGPLAGLLGSLSADLERIGGGTRWAAGGAGSMALDARIGGVRWPSLGWRVDAEGAQDPADVLGTWRQRLTSGVYLVSEPVGRWGAVGRVGAAVSKEHRDPAGAAGGPSVGGARRQMSATKLAAGLTSEVNRHAGSLNLGLELSTSAQGRRLRRALMDASLHSTIDIGSQRVELEQRLQAGRLSRVSGLAEGQAFAASPGEQAWMPGDDWQIRAQPTVRGHVVRPSDVGASSFWSYQLTVALPIWRRPLIPKDLRADPELSDNIASALDSAISILQQENEARSDAFLEAAGHLAPLQQALGELEQRLSQAEGSAATAPAQGEVGECVKRVKGAARRVREALDASGGSQMGTLLTLLPSHTEQRLPKVQEACQPLVALPSADAASRRLVADIEQRHQAIQAAMSRIDRQAARQAAESEVRPARRTLNRLLFETDLLASGPLLLADTASLKPVGGGPNRRLLQVGLGWRLTLVSSLDLSVGYLVNRRQQAADPRGGGFVTMSFKDTFF